MTNHYEGPPCVSSALQLLTAILQLGGGGGWWERGGENIYFISGPLSIRVNLSGLICHI